MASYKRFFVLVASIPLAFLFILKQKLQHKPSHSTDQQTLKSSRDFSLNQNKSQNDRKWRIIIPSAVLDCLKISQK